MHSLRFGLATAAALGGASERSIIMNQTGHRSLTTVRRPIRAVNADWRPASQAR